MRFFFTILCYSLCLQLSHGQALIKEEEITQKIDTFTESQSAQKDEWQQLLQLRKE